MHLFVPLGAERPKLIVCNNFGLPVHELTARMWASSLIVGAVRQFAAGFEIGT